MAEGFCRKYWGQLLRVSSAGIEKHGMNPWAIRVMAEAGIDLSGQYSKTLNELKEESFDFVVTVCDSAKTSCPIYSGGKMYHFGFQDPPALAKGLTNEDDILEIYRKARDEIEAVIKTLPIASDQN